MKKELQTCFVYLANRLSVSFVYDKWTNKVKVAELKLGFKTFYDELAEHIDFTNLTVEEAKELRFKKWDDEMLNLWLFPLYLVPIIPDGLEITYIDGSKGKYKASKMNNNITFRMCSIWYRDTE